MGAMRDRYGAGPLHLLAVAAMLAIAAYGFLRIFAAPNAVNLALWFGGAIIAHDLIAFPLYSLLDRIAFGPLRRARDARETAAARVPATNHLRAPAVLSALAFVVWFPLILGLSDVRYREVSGLSSDVYLERWLLLSAALAIGSALLYAIRLRLAARTPNEEAT